MKIMLLTFMVALFSCAAEVGVETQDLQTVWECEDACGPKMDKKLICHYPPGNPENVQTLCVASKLTPDHLAHGDECGRCVSPDTVCGDDVCEASENCDTCSQDCGECQSFCGDGTCDAEENCDTCSDCGQCPVQSQCDGGMCTDASSEGNSTCGNGICEMGETRETCSEDCCNHSPVCGDGVCDEGESCDDCTRDCGQCPAPDPGPAQPGTAPADGPRTTVTGGKLGGCSTSGGGNLLGLIIVLGAFLLVRKKSLAAVLVTLILVLPAAASAQVSGDPGDFKLERFEMAMDDKSIITVEGAEVGFAGSMGSNFSLGYSNDPLVVQQTSPSGWERTGSLVGNQVSGSIGGYLVLFDDVALGLDAPIVLYQGRDSGDLTGLNDIRSGGLGDPRFMIKYQFANQNDHTLNAAVGGALTMPMFVSGTSYISDNGITATPYVSLSRNYDSWRMAGNLGMKFRPDTELVDLSVSDEVFAKLGLAKSVGAGEVGVTVSSNTSANDMFVDNTSYTELMAGYTRSYGNGWSSLVGVGTGLNDGFGAPDWRAFIGMRFDISTEKEPVYTEVEPTPPPIVEVPEPAPIPVPEPEKVIKLVLTVPEAFFVFDKSEVLPHYRGRLEKFAKQLVKASEDHPELDIFAVVVGHTDSIGSNEYNAELAEERAVAVANVLLENGVPEELIVVISYGEVQPIAPNSTVEGRAKNRRVEVYLGGNDGTLDAYDILTTEDAKPSDETYDSFGNLDIE